ncbi:hypothetical protein Y013_25820 (plasmid) [Rhodococcus pyridinivorans SB3094]|uniref:Uncharacterized protein n=1 Tax=Rhodococcus pyridinivorans SB3094 TaxID=1435356 RepID=V9XSC8_9NOCA|nr:MULTISPECIES: hypothetical protein [Rhodococcus]AHD24302.1 hypothetical protein Y013_25820 [Rhodococcus pyridinivorans SB3094]AYA23260.1 hypothetical protein C6369_000835 [Rhodococcus rhodochrous]
MSNVVPVFISRKETTADALASTVAPNKAWWFPTLREAVKARDHRSQDRVEATCDGMDLLRVTVVEYPPTGAKRKSDMGVSVLGLPQSVASFIDDILRLKIADGVVLEYEDVHVASAEYRNAIKNRLSQIGVTAKFHDVMESS